MNHPQTDPIWVSSLTGLRRLVDHLAQQSLIGVDTESNSLYAYQEQVCLIQFTAGKTDYLVDPIALDDLSTLRKTFMNPGIEKVFHAAEYDLLCLKRDFHFQFDNLFDTMMAARILGRSALGLGTILEQEFGVQVDKRLQRANWARRPLSAEMMDYARMDTHYLVELRNLLKQELVKSGRLELALEDFQRLANTPAASHDDGPADWWRISGAQDLSPRQAAVLVQLCEYREERAKAMDTPPFRVLPNQTLIELAKIMPRKRAELQNIFGLSAKLLDRYGDGLLEAVGRGAANSPAYRPVNHRPDDAVLHRMDSLRQWRKLTAHEMEVESDIVLPRDILEQIAECYPRDRDELGKVMGAMPWRFNQFGEQILAVIA